MIQKIPTGIPGLDHITEGGIPKGRITLVSGCTGSGKTVFAVQFLAEGIQQFQDSGVFVTFEETPQDIQKNVQGFGWNIQKWVRERKWAFVDATPKADLPIVETGKYDLSALLIRIQHAIQSISASRLVFDSLGGLFSQFSNTSSVRREFLRIAQNLKKWGVTTIVTAERNKEYGEISLFGVEEFVADNVILLYNLLFRKKRHRFIEILKFRGTSHKKGEYPFVILPDKGIFIFPCVTEKKKGVLSKNRISSGNSELDKMCGGGFFRGSVVFLNGDAGIGKTYLAIEFAKAGLETGEKVLFVSLDGDTLQVMRKMESLGISPTEMMEKGLLKFLCYHISHGFDLRDLHISLFREVHHLRPQRLVLDGLSLLEKVTPEAEFQEFLSHLIFYLKDSAAVGLFTLTSPYLMETPSVTREFISTTADGLIFLKFVELEDSIGKALTVLKMRDSAHDKRIRQFSIDEKGIQIGPPLKLKGIFLGLPSGTLQEDRS